MYSDQSGQVNIPCKSDTAAKTIRITKNLSRNAIVILFPEDSFETLLRIRKATRKRKATQTHSFVSAGRFDT